MQFIGQSFIHMLLWIVFFFFFPLHKTTLDWDQRAGVLIGSKRTWIVFWRWVERLWWARTFFSSRRELTIWEPRKEANERKVDSQCDIEDFQFCLTIGSRNSPQILKSVGTPMSELTYQAENLKIFPQSPTLLCLPLLQLSFSGLGQSLNIWLWFLSH